MNKCKDCGKSIEVPKDGRCDDCIKIVYSSFQDNKKFIDLNIINIYFQDCTQVFAVLALRYENQSEYFNKLMYKCIQASTITNEILEIMEKEEKENKP